MTVADRATLWFPLAALAVAVLAFVWPHWLTPARPLIPWLLGVAMFAMGVTLSWRQFLRVFTRPERIALGVALQFLLMPFLGWAVGLALALPTDLLLGMVLVGASPGGTASNLICWLARGDLALSITLTSASTLLAVVATPLLTWVYAGALVPVPVAALLVTVAQVVLLPVALGVLAHRLLETAPGRRLTPLVAVLPLLSMAAILGIIAIVVALNQANLAGVGAMVVLAVVLHNGGGLAAGYLLGRLATGDERTARTLAIEVGMQNSGLAATLAVQSFSAAAALPAALFSVWHNLSGALLAVWWARRPVER